MKFIWRSILACTLELKIIAITIVVITSLPIIAIIVIVGGGISEASDTLTSYNPVTKRIQVRDARGDVVADFVADIAWPTRGYISDTFGAHDPERKALGLGPHTGVDIAHRRNAAGEPVTVFLKGTVKSVVYGNKGYGNYVLVDHGYNLISVYGHLSSISTTVGSTIVPGNIIGRMGTSGMSTGVHLHFEVRVYGVPVNPLIYMSGTPLESSF
jgi:murein DD-endopeptidase MepM/ murein hydrolase activator NlpD